LGHARVGGPEWTAGNQGRRGGGRLPGEAGLSGTRAGAEVPEVLRSPSMRSREEIAYVRKAFTLIELLVVIAIIAVLAAILFPVFA